MLKFLLVVAVALSFQLPAAAQADEASDIAAVRSSMADLDKAFVSEDVAAIKLLVTEDHIAIGPAYDGPVSIDEQIAMFPRITLSEWVPAESEISLQADSVAMSNVEISVRGTVDGALLPSRVYATEIWVKRDGTWLQRLYQETEINDR